MKSIWTAPPRYQFPCSKYGRTRPTPAPNPMGIIAAYAGLPIAATPNCHSAVEEQPIVPTLPLDHLHIGIPALHGVQFGAHVARHTVAHVPVVEVVRRAHENHRVFLGGVLGAVDIGGHALGVAHGHQELALNDGDRLELLLPRHALGGDFLAQPGPSLLALDSWDGGDCRHCESQKEDDPAHAFSPS